MKSIVYRLAISSIVLSILGIIIYGFQSLSYGTYRVVVHTDSFLSQQACQEINNFFQEPQSLISMQHVIGNVQKQLPYIKSVRYVCRTQGIIDIFVAAYYPYLLWNSTHALVEQAMVPREYFASEHLYGLSQVSGRKCVKEITPYVCQILLTIPPDMFEKYYITWQDRTKIFFTAKNGLQYTVLVDDNSCSNFLKIEKAFDIFYEKHVKNSQKNSQDLVYDIRFDKQIIEYVMKGMWDEEQRVV